MTTLGSVKSWSGGDYLGVGDHRVIINGYSTGKLPKGTLYLDLDLVEVDGGRKSKDRFFLTEKALGKLAACADAAGLTPAQKDEYDPFNEDSHAVLLDRELNVRIEHDGKYHNVSRYWAVDGVAPAGQAKSAPAPQPVAAGVDDDDDVPF